MRVDRSEETGTDPVVVVLLVRDVHVRARVAVLLREAKVDDVHDKVRVPVRARNDEVCRLDVTVNEVARVDVFNARYLGRTENVSAMGKHGEGTQDGRIDTTMDGAPAEHFKRPATATASEAHQSGATRDDALTRPGTSTLLNAEGIHHLQVGRPGVI